MYKIKVCGMRNNANIKALADINPDFIGFIFHEESSRNVTEIITTQLPKHIAKVGVFVNKSLEFIQEKVNLFNLDLIQLHGNETPEFCANLKQQGYNIIKAFNVSENFDFSSTTAYQSHCDYFLFDAFGKQAGGNGITFNWALLQQYTGNTPFLLSGGITPTMANTIKNFKHNKCVGIDINSGFETAPALKNIEDIQTFFNQLKAN
ncbi:MAG: phosphoribosylanthranilate isomerase [Flavobacteriaceae bacterium]